MITVAIPVGPSKVYRQYLQECIDSLKVQMVAPSEVLIIDDMAGVKDWGIDFGDLPIRIHENPWLCGGACSFNFGVALAANELVLMLGSDDCLRPWAIADCLTSWEHEQDPLGFYFCDVEYSDTGEKQGCACNCAMVTKTLWRLTGGFPPASAAGAWDTILLSIMIGNAPRAGNIIRVKSAEPPFWYRRHNESVTSKSGDMFPVVKVVRDVLTAKWTRPDWPRRM